MTPEFEKTLQWAGTPVALCHCGRTHYVANGENMEPDGELQRLEAKHKAEPDSYIPDAENDSISIAALNGIPHVWNCPCRSLDRIEAFLWGHRESFIQYYRERTARELKEATANAAALSTMPN